MADYYELNVFCDLKPDTPQSIIDTLNDVINLKSNKTVKILDEIEINTVLWGGSYYFPDTPKPSFTYDDIRGSWSLHARANTSNRSGQIQAFIKWLEPYVEDGVGLLNIWATVICDMWEVPIFYALDGKVKASFVDYRD